MKRDKCQKLIHEFRSILKKYKIEEQSLTQSANLDDENESHDSVVSLIKII